MGAVIVPTDKNHNRRGVGKELERGLWGRPGADGGSQGGFAFMLILVGLLGAANTP